MIGYATVGTRDLERARAFYDALFAQLGARRLMEMESGFTLYGTGFGTPGVAVTPPYDGEAATPGNGTMVALALDGRGKVDALHARALELGGSDEGAPGLRGPEGPRPFYGAYFRDLDGNKFCAFRVGPA
jgi:catechol 2,3-dioxygenase-like lactoylglutathione lyase family enzyme